MTRKPSVDFFSILKKFAGDITDKFALPVAFGPEDQLKGAVEEVLRGAGNALKLNVAAVTEVRVQELAGRPDVGVTVDGLLIGHVELKAPGKGADPKKFKGADKVQWDKFKDLPNLIYTDGNDWALYRTGERVGKIIRLSGDITSDGASAVSSGDADALLGLFREFLGWIPVVPSSPKALAEMLAPLCRLLRTDVLTALQDPDSNLSALAGDWRQYLFPDADDKQFADAYAQTLTYALLLARFSGAIDLSVTNAAKAIRTGHRLLADTLKILGDESAREQIEVPVSLLERVIAVVNVTELEKKSKGDPWLYFYEDFLAAYDPKMRKDRGVYYTPIPVVQTQVRLVADLLSNQFNAEFSFVDPKVITLDPASGTGTYILTAVKHALDHIASVKGSGMRVSAASTAAMNMHAFELLVGPYAVAHLRLTQQIMSEGGTLPTDGVHVYLTDTLESPYATPPGHLPLALKPLGEEHKRAIRIKAETPVLVCIGNPPYDRQTITDSDQSTERRKGGWVRYGDHDKDRTGILRDFIDPLTESGRGQHAKNLYNDYVYFWRWALWKVFEAKSGPGIVSFITASSYLRGPGFAGMRQVMRETFDELWIIDLEGGNLGARKTENVFVIQTPVAIAIGVRYGGPTPESQAVVHYTRIEGTQSEKLDSLSSIHSFADLEWQQCPANWQDPFLPIIDSVFFTWPLLTDLFPWQENGIKAGRSWPIATTEETLRRRWTALMKSQSRRSLFKDSPTGRKFDRTAPHLDSAGEPDKPISKLPAGTPAPQIMRYSFRSFDREWILADSRLLDRPSPALWSAHSNEQIYLTSLLTEVLGEGPSAVVTGLIPDLHHFRGSFGGAHVIPLWRDVAASEPNVTTGVLELLSSEYGQAVSAEDLFAYCYAMLATPSYVQYFWEELFTPGPRIPITTNSGAFNRAVSIGHELIWLHTYAERFVPNGKKEGRVPAGKARISVGTPTSPAEYPEDFHYDPAKQELHIGGGIFANVSADVWGFSVSGYEVLESWLAYRMRKRAGKKSSALDDISPQTWQFDEELLDLIWILEATVKLLPEVKAVLDEVLQGDLFIESELPAPSDQERRPPRVLARPEGFTLFDMDGAEAYSDEDSEE